MAESNSNGRSENVEKIQKQMLNILKDLKPTQKSIHDSSAWFLKATADDNLALVPRLAKLWRQFYDSCNNNSNRYETRLSLMYFANDVLQFGKRHSNQYEEHFTPHILQLISHLIKNNNELRKNGKSVAKILDTWITRNVFNADNHAKIVALYKQLEGDSNKIDIIQAITQLKNLEHEIAAEKNGDGKINQHQNRFTKIYNSNMPSDEKVLMLKEMRNEVVAEMNKMEKAIRYYQNLERSIFKMVSNLKQEYSCNQDALASYDKALSDAKETLKRINNHLASLPDMSALLENINVDDLEY